MVEMADAAQRPADPAAPEAAPGHERTTELRCGPSGYSGLSDQTRWIRLSAISKITTISKGFGRTPVMRS